MIKAVLFDLDGTLIDSVKDLALAADQMRENRGLPALGWQQYRSSASGGARLMVATALAGEYTQHHEYQQNFPNLKAEFLANYEKCLLDNTCLFEGVDHLIQEITKLGLSWGIVTNKFTRYTYPIVQSISLLMSAQTVVCGDTTEFFKPHPLPLRLASRQIGVSCQDCWYVGDDIRDMEAGISAHMHTVFADYGYIRTEAGAPLSTLVYDRIEMPEQLLYLLERYAHHK
ncbi:MAG: HAD hydrolase-like protein [Gammaproteobacteria bacterium]|nr:HAD hydrolase-like protein [Gammaproteobacteria bacterium]